MTATLKENVKYSALNQAVSITAKRFPYFSVSLGSGLFWHFLEFNDQLPRIQVEEEIFYPAVRQARDPKAEDLVIASMHDHHGIDDILDELSMLNPNDELFDAKVHELEQRVVQHVQEEESAVFEEARKYFTIEALEQLGEEMADRKRSLRQEDIDQIR